MDDDEDEVPTCPLCLEELDATDRAVKACQCGYQVCLWCLHQIREQHTGRCPACRTPYEEQNFKFAEVNPELAAKEAKERATAKKERERREKLKEVERERARAVAASQQKAKNNLKHAQILQRNLVYVIGLSLTLAREEVIRRADMFGKFGRIIRVLINRSHPFNADAPGGPSISAYVQYYRDSDASAAVRAMSNVVFDGREIRCAIATTKYCDAFLRNASVAGPSIPHHCGNPQCLYYHAISPAEAVLTREEVLARQLGPPPPAHLFLADNRRQHPQGPPYHRSVQPPPPPMPIPSISLPIGHGTSSSGSPGRSGLPRVPGGPGLPNNAIQTQVGNMHGPTSVTNGGLLGTTQTSPRALVGGAAGNDVYATGSSVTPQLGTSSEAQTVMPPGTSRSNAMQPHRVSPLRPLHMSPPLSPDAKFHTARHGRSPSNSDPSLASFVPVAHPSLAGSEAGAATASAAPFFSPPSSGMQLPSNAGWASSHANGRSRSPRRPTALGDSSKGRSRLPLRHSGDGPPGFVDMSTSHVPVVPSRPPGFDNRNSRQYEKASNVRSPTQPCAFGSAPPGFGPTPSVPRDAKVEHGSVSDVAAAWSQEASADEVFSANERRAKKPVGGPSIRASPEVQDNQDARSELAQVLAKIGGDFGVSSEFQNMKAVPVSTPGPTLGTGLRAVTSRQFQAPPFCSLFGTEPPNDDNASHPSVKGQQFDESRLRSSDCRPTFPSPFSNEADQRSASGTPRRSTSRFDFARRFRDDGIAAGTPNPISTLSKVATSAQDRKDTSRVPVRDTDYRSTGTQGESQSLRELSRDAPEQLPVSNPSQVVGRHSRSRFHFADQDVASPKTQHLSPNHLAEPVVESHNALLDNDDASDAFGATFANLTTAEKLASIFSSAQWSAERLPPMPTYDTQVDEGTGQETDLNVSVSRDVTSPAVVMVPNAASSSNQSDAQHHSTPRAAPEPRTTQLAPPGFREATPGISPETTAVDKSSTFTGVAASVTCGGEAANVVQSATSGQIDESLSSGTESLEEDRKRSRAQRKRDKKARQSKEAAERKAMELRTPKPVTTTTRSIGSPTKPKETRTTSLTPTPNVGEIENTSPVQILAKAKETTKSQKQTKLIEDSGRFMSVSELEREVEAARAREAQLQDKLLELQRRIRSYDHVRT